MIGALVVLLFPRSSSRTSARRTICKNNLKQIGLALHSYHDHYGCFPPAYIADDRGRPMHSWRVLILPYLDWAPLYNKYRFDEPWDGPNNSKLSEKCPIVFQCPSDVEACDESLPWTSYVAVIGPRTCWPGAEPLRIGEVADGTSVTLHVVEVRTSGIHWMEPRDLHVTEMASSINPRTGQGISSAHEGGADVLLADGSVRFIDEKVRVETLNRLIERDDGEDVGEF